ncbi:MAG TPA: hypothetical protein PLH25_02650 [Flavobacterium sp.]|jgi:hypothetical protein|nr:hypothetical protein [Flavobacterium sp.]HQW68540.1 hypothetical protein [Flavobacterium sp.]
MKNFQLTPHLEFDGIGAASGLVYHNEQLYIISDSSNYLHHFDTVTADVNKIVFFEKAEDNMSKDKKPDFECVTLEGDTLYLFGSGSTENRNLGMQLSLVSKKAVGVDFSDFYNTFKKAFSIPDTDFNIEGVCFGYDYHYFFQRGNGSNNYNGVFIIQNIPFEENPSLEFIRYDFPKISNVAPTFTDAIMIDDKIYFLAAAEDTNSTYDDGKVLGSIIGCINTKTMNVEFTILISEKHKFEGLTLYEITDDGMEFLLCEDNDSDVLETIIYRLII